MVRGLYAAATGMAAQQQVQDALAGNLANLNTNGYKQDVPVFRALPTMTVNRVRGGSIEAPLGEIGLGAQFLQLSTDLSVGSIRQTGNWTDIAIQGDGYFTIQTPNGPRYSRDGQFTLKVGQGAGAPVTLADGKGNALMGEKGPIQIPAGKEAVINPLGEVLVDKTVVDRIQIVSFAPGALRKEGDNLFSSAAAPSPSKATLMQGALENANVNAVSAMVRMISVQRAYDAAQKAVQSQDEILGKASNDLGRS